MKNPSDDSTKAFIFLLATIAFAIGIGCLWGAGFGWLTFGGILFALFFVAVI